MRNLWVIRIIALSMMVVVPAVAPNSVRAQDREMDRGKDSESGASAPAAAGPVTGDGQATQATDEQARKPKRKAKPAGAPTEEAEPPRFFGGPAQSNHKYQTGLSIMPGYGYRLIVPYKEGQNCGDSSGVQSKRVCAHSVPFFLDFQLSFGVAARADIIADIRFGLQSDPTIKGGHQFSLAPGLRFWLDQDVALKFYTTLQFVFDYMDYKNTGPSNSDYGVRNANGLMYDPIRNVGFFIQFGETIGFARWFRIDLDIGLGAQVRFP